MRSGLRSEGNSVNLFPLLEAVEYQQPERLSRSPKLPKRLMKVRARRGFVARVDPLKKRVQLTLGDCRTAVIHRVIGARPTVQADVITSIRCLFLNLSVRRTCLATPRPSLSAVSRSRMRNGNV